MKKQFYFFILSLCIANIPAFAGVLKGKITDTKGEPLPFATVYIQGTANGTAANAEAQYQLTLVPGTYKVTCQYMGFKPTTFNITIQGEETVTHHFSLQEQTLTMKDVVVKANAEDPAYGIMRKVIKRRQFHLEQIKTFQTSLYLKGVFRNRQMPGKILGVMNKKDSKELKNDMGWDSTGRGVLYLCEEDADYYTRGDKRRTIIRSVRESGNPYGIGMANIPPVITFYENNVKPFGGFAPRGFVSPVSDNAIFYYKFKYEGEFRTDGYVIDKIKVIPRRAYEPLMYGTIYIVEEDWAIQSLDLWATAKSGMEIIDSLNVRQTYLPSQKDLWVIKDQVIYPTLKVLGFDISGYFMTVYQKQKVNEQMPDSLFDDKVMSSYDKGANKKDTSYWTSARPVPLEADESRDYKFKDSVEIRTSDPKYIDSVRRKENHFEVMDIVMGGYTYSSKKYKNRYSTNSIVGGMVNYNTIEGLNVTPKLHWMHTVDTGKVFNSVFAARYGFSNTHFNGIGKIEYRKSDRTWRGRYWNIGVQGGKYVFQFNPQTNITPFFNTFTTLLQGKNFMKLYERVDAAAFVERNYGNGLQWNAKLNFQDRTSLHNTTDYTWASDGINNMTTNLPGGMAWMAHRAAIAKASISYQPGHKYIQLPDYKVGIASRWPTFMVSYEKGMPGIADSKTDFDKWRLAVTDNMRLKLLGNIGYNIAIGGFLNKAYVAPQDLMHLTDNQLILAAPYKQSFQLAPYYMYSNAADFYVEAHIEYNMQGLLTNKIPLLRQAKWYAVAGNNTFFVNENNYYTEAFVGIDNLGFKAYRVLRVDFIQSWNNTGASMTGIRLGIKFSAFPTSVKLGNDENDF